jgi:hypothetical protein
MYLSADLFFKSFFNTWNVLEAIFLLKSQYVEAFQNQIGIIRNIKENI